MKEVIALNVHFHWFLFDFNSRTRPILTIGALSRKPKLSQALRVRIWFMLLMLSLLIKKRSLRSSWVFAGDTPLLSQIKTRVVQKSKVIIISQDIITSWHPPTVHTFHCISLHLRSLWFSHVSIIFTTLQCYGVSHHFFSCAPIGASFSIQLLGFHVRSGHPIGTGALHFLLYHLSITNCAEKKNQTNF